MFTRREDLHPELRRALWPTVPFHWTFALPLWRWAIALSPPVSTRGVHITHHHVDEVRLRIYQPARGASGGALLWLHGGGLIAGRPEMDDARCTTWARDLGLVVVSPDYRLAPEHPFPAALDDAHAAWTWLHREASRLGIDPASVAVGGASAGGGLAACLCQRLRDAQGPQPAAQLLVYPMLDDRTAARRDLDREHRLVWPNRNNRVGWAAYLAAEPGADAVPAYASAARTSDLSGLPAAWIGVGSIDLFHAEDLAYAARLHEAGVAVEVEEVPGAPHGFDVLAPRAPVTATFAEAQAGFLRARLGVPQEGTP